MKYIGIILLFGLLMGCTAQQRLDRLIHKHPELAIQDTLTIEHETIIESIIHDTSFSIERFFQSDTIYIHKDRFHVELLWDTINNTVYVSGGCEGDTIYETIRVPYTKYEYKEPGWWKQHWLEILIVLAIGGVLYKLFRK